MSQDFQVSAVGSFGPRDQWNPYHVISSLDAWPVLRQLNQAPAVTMAVPPEGLAQLEALGVIRRDDDGRYILGFAWYSQADQDAISEAVLPTAAALAESIYARRNEIDGLIQSLTSARWSDPRDLRFALVGCFGLDWGGLHALKATGHLVHEKSQPGGRRYVMYVQDTVERHNQKDYTGSHRTDSNRFTWTSFGDHSGRRFGLPDLLFDVSQTVRTAEAFPAGARPLIAGFVLEGLAPHLEAAAEALVGVAQGQTPEGIGMMLLQATEAIRAGRPAVPVFFRSHDGDAMDGVIRMVTDATLSQITEDYALLHRTLAGLPALRNGVPFAECFNFIWHVLFGHVNRLLAEQGYLADPVPTHPGEGRYRWWLTVQQ